MTTKQKYKYSIGDVNCPENDCGDCPRCHHYGESEMTDAPATERFAVTRHKDGTIIGWCELTPEQFAHYNTMAQQPEGLMRLGAMPHDWYELNVVDQDTHEDTTIYLD